LKGESIPLCARIVALADVFDALRMERGSKGSMTHEVARGIILEGEGNHFDPLVVRAFLAVEEQFRQISISHPDKA
jgi:putative two-component system response regulator